MAKKKKKSWQQTTYSILAMLLWTFAAVIASQLVLGYLLLWILGPETLSQPLWSAIYSALAYLLAMALVIFVPPKLTKLWQSVKQKEDDKKKTKKKIATGKVDKEELGIKGWPTWTDIGLSLVGFVAQLILAAILVGIFSIFPWFDAGEAQDVGFSLSLTGLDRIIAFISLVIVAPIAEEIIFRGWLYGKLRRKLSEQVSNTAGMIISIFLVSLLFGIVHLQWNVGVNVFALSVVLCGLRELTGTIYSGILLHMIKNGVAFYLLYVLGVG